MEIMAIYQKHVSCRLGNGEQIQEEFYVLKASHKTKQASLPTSGSEQSSCLALKMAWMQL